MDDRLDGRPKVRCLGLGADPASLLALRDRLVQAGAEEAAGGATLCAIGLSHAHPEALLLRLLQSGSGLTDAPHPELDRLRSRLQSEVLGGCGADPYRAAWDLLEDLQRKGWVLPLPSVG